MKLERCQLSASFEANTINLDECQLLLRLMQSPHAVSWVCVLLKLINNHTQNYYILKILTIILRPLHTSKRDVY